MLLVKCVDTVESITLAIDIPSRNLFYKRHHAGNITLQEVDPGCDSKLAEDMAGHVIAFGDVWQIVAYTAENLEIFKDIVKCPGLWTEERIDRSFRATRVIETSLKLVFRGSRIPS
jgi:hypothetical protein